VFVFDVCDVCDGCQGTANFKKGEMWWRTLCRINNVPDRIFDFSFFHFLCLRASIMVRRNAEKRTATKLTLNNFIMKLEDCYMT
jgi:hypothetical protein